MVVKVAMVTTRTSTVGTARNRQAGFTYILLLIAVVVLGILAGAAHIMTSHVVREDKEAELLFRGEAYRHAIAAYYAAGRTVKSYPRNLQDLVNDPRYANRHYLRRLYHDPLTGGKWEVVRAPDGGVSGVFSAAPGKPLKQGNFPPDERNFAKAKSYASWVFEYTPPAPGKPGASGLPAPGTGNSTVQ